MEEIILTSQVLSGVFFMIISYFSNWHGVWSNLKLVLKIGQFSIPNEQVKKKMKTNQKRDFLANNKQEFM